MTFEIRPARREDSEDIADLLRELDLFAHIQAESPEETRSRTLEQLRLALSDASHTIHIAMDDEGKVVGFLSIHWLPYLILRGPEGFISELFIHPGIRGQGAGKALLDAAAREAATRGCSRMSLLNFRDRESYQRQFYAKHGWNERTDAANFVFPIPAD